ncbi:hypothetical protein C8J56DRAFT_5387 [Mycena floridula]|nr:hypothetical protein C8J56DRAFT_979202 [Mycena floridula]KAJ7600193.1 hypothetical protein C8J56DRAFT_5387 [Mycena floridula]
MAVLSSFPADILLIITNLLHLDALPLLMTCHAFYALAEKRIFWIGILDQYGKRNPLPLPPFTDLASLTLEELKTVTTRARRLERNLAKTKPQFIDGLVKFYSFPGMVVQVVFVIPGTKLVILHFQGTKLACMDIESGVIVAEVAFLHEFCYVECMPHFVTGKCIFGLSVSPTRK